MSDDNKSIKSAKATASDVAKAAGVSKWTVSRAFTEGSSISEKSRIKVREAAEKLGYKPNLLARSLSKKRTNIIGIVIDEMKNPHCLMLLDEATRQLQYRGCIALLINLSGVDDTDVLSLADQLQVDGILFLGAVLSENVISMAENLHHVPLVQVGRNSELVRFDRVYNNGYDAGKEIARLMAPQGFNRYGYMKGPEAPSNHLFRMQGFRDGLAEFGKTLSVMLVAGHYDRHSAADEYARYIESTPPAERIEALFCENDILALGVMDQQMQLGLPALGIAGFDDIDEAGSASRQLTTVSQRVDRQIHEALNRLLDSTASPQDTWSTGEIKVRQSHLKK